MLILKGLAGSVYQVALFAALLLIPAGTWRWPRAIQFLVVFGGFLLVSTFLLAILAPSSLEARLQMPTAKDQPLADRWITPPLLLAICGWLAFIPVDVFRLRLLPPTPLWLSSTGAIVACFGMLVMALAIAQNAYAAPVVTNQSERGQRLVDAGLYGLVRHPLYLGLVLFLVGVALWLESTASVAILVPVLALLVVRILIEERNLCRTLSGYAEYRERVPFRLVPWVW